MSQLRPAVSTQYRLVTDRQTDRRTDGQRVITNIALAQRRAGKN